MTSRKCNARCDADLIVKSSFNEVKELNFFDFLWEKFLVESDAEIYIPYVYQDS